MAASRARRHKGGPLPPVPLLLLLFLAALRRAEAVVQPPRANLSSEAVTVADLKSLCTGGPAPVIPVRNATIVELREVRFEEGRSVRFFFDGACASSAAQPRPAPDPSLLFSHPFTTMHQALLSGAATCTDLVAAFLRRVDAFEPGTGLNAISERPTAAGLLADAAKADVVLAAAQRGNTTSTLPPLFCVPLLVKDNIDSAGLPTTGGSVALATNVVLADATSLKRLKDAGAFVLGKANMGEWALNPAATISSTRGATRNPWALDLTPAGSSGGSAAGVAAGYAPAALGTDTGNSVRGPAGRAGLVGLRPSLGLVSRAGVLPLDATADTVGPLARTVADVALLADSLAAPDPASDPLTGWAGDGAGWSPWGGGVDGAAAAAPAEALQAAGAPRPWSARAARAAAAGSAAATAGPGANLTSLPAGHFSAAAADGAARGATAGGLAGLRVGVLACALEGGNADAEHAALFEAAIKVLEDAGATIAARNFTIRGNALGSVQEWACDRGQWWTGWGDDGRLPPSPGGAPLIPPGFEAITCAGRLAPDVATYLATAPRPPAIANLTLRGVAAAGRVHPATAFPLAVRLASPGSGRPAPPVPHNWTGAAFPPPDLASAAASEADDAGGDDPDAYPSPALRRAAGLACGCGPLWTNACRSEMRARLVAGMDGGGLDVVIHPTWGLPPPAIGAPVAAGPDGNPSPLIAPPTGAPAVAVPAGWTAAGLPFSLSIIARPFDDAGAMRVAAGFEAAARVERRAPPLFHECT